MSGNPPKNIEFFRPTRSIICLLIRAAIKCPIVDEDAIVEASPWSIGIGESGFNNITRVGELHPIMHPTQNACTEPNWSYNYRYNYRYLLNLDHVLIKIYEIICFGCF